MTSKESEDEPIRAEWVITPLQAEWSSKTLAQQYFGLKSQLRQVLLEAEIQDDTPRTFGLSSQKDLLDHVGPAIALLTSSGTAVTFYRVVKLWFERNVKREIKVKVGGLEIEATGFSEEEFVQLFEIARKAQKRSRASGKV